MAAARTLLTSMGLAEPPWPVQGSRLARADVRSPIDGVVVERTLALGAPVALEKTLVRVLASTCVSVAHQVLTTRAGGTPVLVKDVADVPEGAAFRQAATTQDGLGETV